MMRSTVEMVSREVDKPRARLVRPNASSMVHAARAPQLSDWLKAVGSISSKRSCRDETHHLLLRCLSTAFEIKSVNHEVDTSLHPNVPKRQPG